MNHSIACRAARELAPEASGPDRLAFGLSRHAATCLRCQATTVRYGKLKRSLGELVDVTETAPPRLIPAVEASIVDLLSSHEDGRPRGRALATAAGAAAAAASVVFVAVWRRARAAA